MIPLLDAGDARNWARDNDTILQEIFVISLAINDATALGELSVTVGSDIAVNINGSSVTGTIMTNQDATGLSYYSTWSDQTTDPKLTEQMDTVIKYFEKYKYSITRISTTGSSISWLISW